MHGHLDWFLSEQDAAKARADEQVVVSQVNRD